jgi:hypothetical protein
MTDAIALLAISQLVCLAGLAYLYAQVQVLRRGGGRVHRTPSPRVHPIERPIDLAIQQSNQQAARRAYAGPGPRRAGGAPALAAMAGDPGLDIAALARRMRRSEEEVRLLLRRQGAIR